LKKNWRRENGHLGEKTRGGSVGKVEGKEKKKKKASVLGEYGIEG